MRYDWKWICVWCFRLLVNTALCLVISNTYSFVYWYEFGVIDYYKRFNIFKDVKRYNIAYDHNMVKTIPQHPVQSARLISMGWLSAWDSEGLGIPSVVDFLQSALVKFSLNLIWFSPLHYISIVIYSLSYCQLPVIRFHYPTIWVLSFALKVYQCSHQHKILLQLN